LLLVPSAVLILFLLTGLTVDGAAIFLAQRELADACAGAANDAATMALDPRGLYGRSRPGWLRRPEPGRAARRPLAQSGGRIGDRRRASPQPAPPDSRSGADRPRWRRPVPGRYHGHLPGDQRSRLIPRLGATPMSSRPGMQLSMCFLSWR